MPRAATDNGANALLLFLRNGLSVAAESVARAHGDRFRDLLNGLILGDSSRPFLPATNLLSEINKLATSKEFDESINELLTILQTKLQGNEPQWLVPALRKPLVLMSLMETLKDPSNISEENRKDLTALLSAELGSALTGLGVAMHAGRGSDLTAGVGGDLGLTGL